MRKLELRRAVISLMLLVFLAGLASVLYPYVWGAAVDISMANTAKDFLARLEEDPDKDIPNVIVPSTEPEESRQYPELWEAMTAYNQRIYTDGQSSLSEAGTYQAILFTLTDYGLPDETFGVISIPKLDLEMPLYLGATDENIAKGAAVLSGTSVPIGGSNTNAVIAGHRGWGGAAYFRYITDLAVGDEVVITNLWERLRYRVVGTKIIEPHEIENILIQPGRDMVTLLTCHPYASGGKQRYVRRLYGDFGQPGGFVPKFILCRQIFRGTAQVRDSR